jgi:hypothetical protein
VLGTGGPTSVRLQLAKPRAPKETTANARKDAPASFMHRVYATGPAA